MHKVFLLEVASNQAKVDFDTSDSLLFGFMHFSCSFGFCPYRYLFHRWLVYQCLFFEEYYQSTRRCLGKIEGTTVSCVMMKSQSRYTIYLNVTQ